jgi:peptidoglycan hydrolase-like protein with peptidoglycan-binding domain
LILLALLAGLGLVFVVWGITSSRPVTVAALAPAEEQWGEVSRGPLIEETSLEGTLSRGEVFSVNVAQAAPATPATTTPASTPTTGVSGDVAAGTVTDAAAATPGATATATATDTESATTTTTIGLEGSTSDLAGNGQAGASRASTRIVTYLPTVGATLKSGDIAFAVDGRPTVMLSGSVPAWRTIGATTTSGVDVLQLETALAAMGFDSGGWLEVDGTVDEATVEAIKEWQRSLEVEATGEVSAGEVIFEPGEVSVVALNSTVGSVVTPGSALIDLRRGSPYVDISVDSSWVAVGDTVAVSFDQNRFRGTVASLESGIARIALANSGVRDGAAARVTLTRQRVDDALLVPVSAVLVSDVDGPTLKVRDGKSAARTVRVKVVAASDGQAAVEPIGATLAVGTAVRMY